jgi:intron-binding protein aquarius
MYGETQRPVAAEFEGAVMEDVEHLGKYVYQMTNAKVEALRANGGAMPTREVDMGDAIEVKDEDEDRPEDVVLSDEVVDGEDEE